jgi:hypothetical protein
VDVCRHEHFLQKKGLIPGERKEGQIYEKRFTSIIMLDSSLTSRYVGPGYGVDGSDKGRHFLQ